MIEFHKVSKSFRTDFWTKPFTALTDITFHIKSNEITGFLGANGTGKTTSLKILMKFISADSGEVRYNSALGKNFNEIVNSIGYMPERPYFYPALTAREFLLYMGSLNEVKKNILRERINRWSKRLQIDQALDRKIHGFSKGMLQRLGFVSILIHDPKLLILDEPLSGLDPVGRKEMKDVLVEVHREGKTIFFSSHIVSDVEEICKKVIVLEKGHLVYDGPIDALIEKNQELHFLIKFKSDKKIDLAEIVLEEEVEAFNYHLKIKPTEVNQKLSELIKRNCQILSVQSTRPTLEEIVYNLGK